MARPSRLSQTAAGLTNANPSTLVTFPVGNPGAATPATINFPNVGSPGFEVSVRPEQGSVGGAPVSPNTGNPFDVGPLGVDTTDNAGFDIAQASRHSLCIVRAGRQPGQLGAAQAQVSTGAATAVGTIAGGMPLESLSLVPASVLEFPGPQRR